MIYEVQNKYNGKVYYRFNNRQDSENAILHLEDMYGMNYGDLEVVEVEV